MNLKLENFIGKSVDEVLTLGEIKSEGENLYYLKLKTNGSFFGQSFSQIALTKTDAVLIDFLYIIMPKILNKP